MAEKRIYTTSLVNFFGFTNNRMPFYSGQMVFIQ